MQIEKYITKIEGANIINLKALRDDHKYITTEEATFLAGLMFYPNNEIITRPDGKQIELDPISVALYDFIHGATIVKELGMSIDPNVDKHIGLAKSIFKKNNPKQYPNFF